jgi:hypothetical protein
MRAKKVEKTGKAHFHGPMQYTLCGVRATRWSTMVITRQQKHVTCLKCKKMLGI